MTAAPYRSILCRRTEAALPEWANATTQKALEFEVAEFWDKEAERLRELKKDL